jgi:hypothetical protein
MKILYDGIGANKTGEHTETEFLHIMNREFTHKSWRHEFVRTPERGVSEAESVGVRGFACFAGVSGWRLGTPTGLSGDGLPSKDKSVIPREHHVQLDFKGWYLPDDFVFFTLLDWIEYSGAEITE